MKLFIYIPVVPKYITLEYSEFYTHTIKSMSIPKYLWNFHINKGAGWFVCSS